MDVRELSLARAEQAARANRAEVDLTASTARSNGCAPRARRCRGAGRPGAGQPRSRSRRSRRRARAARPDGRATRAIANYGAVRRRRVRPDATRSREVARGEVIARVVNPDELEIRLFVPLRHVRAIQRGDAVDVIADRRRFTATVSTIVPAGDARSQSFEVLVKAPAVDGLFAPGSTVDVELPLGEPQRSSRCTATRSSFARRECTCIASTRRTRRTRQRQGGHRGRRLDGRRGRAEGGRSGHRARSEPRGDEPVQVVGIFDPEPQVAVK